MRLDIVGKNIEVTEGIKFAIENSVNELDKYFEHKEISTKVVVKTYPVGSKVEISVFIDANHTLRQEVLHEDLYAAIDLAGKKLEKQIRKFNDRLKHSKKGKEDISVFLSEEVGEAKEPVKVIRRKVLENKPMSEEEALLQFEITGHDFFVFEDYEVEMNKVIYKRKDGAYGIIEIQ